MEAGIIIISLQHIDEEMPFGDISILSKLSKLLSLVSTNNGNEFALLLILYALTQAYIMCEKSIYKYEYFYFSLVHFVIKNKLRTLKARQFKIRATWKK